MTHGSLGRIKIDINMELKVNEKWEKIFTVK